MFKNIENNEHNYLDENQLKIGDKIVVGEYCSDSRGCPMLKWSEIEVTDLPLPYTVVYIKRK